MVIFRMRVLPLRAIASHPGKRRRSVWFSPGASRHVNCMPVISSGCTEEYTWRGEGPGVREEECASLTPACVCTEDNGAEKSRGGGLQARAPQVQSKVITQLYMHY